VPEDDPHFIQSTGQPACITCHGGGLPSLDHGYATLADLFNYDPKGGFLFYTAPTISTMKSLGSNANNRQKTSTCNMTSFTTCNPDSSGVTSTNWDVSVTWGANGMLKRLGWNAPTSGSGLNSLGSAIGQSSIFYVNWVNRVIAEICPLGAVAASDITNIASDLKSNNDLRRTVAYVASNAACQ
jgi:hypothetical protein